MADEARSAAEGADPERGAGAGPEDGEGRSGSSRFKLPVALVPLGTAIAGFGTDLWGAQVTLGTMAGLMVLLAVFVAGRRLVATAASSTAG